MGTEKLNKEGMMTLLRREVVPALGCTEPGCVALAAADAAAALGGEVKRLSVVTNPGIYKNGKSVAIPGFSRVGLKYAAALGALLHNPEKGLQLFSELAANNVSSQAIKLVEDGLVSLEIAEEEYELYVKVAASGPMGSAISIIRSSHANIIYTAVNEVAVRDTPWEAGGEDALHSKLRGMSVKDILSLVECCQKEELSFMLAGVKMNEEVADYGLSNPLSIGIASGVDKMCRNGVFGDSLASRIFRKIASAAEVRMSGCLHSVMSSAGSGNHGLTVILPVVETARYLHAPEPDLVRALAFAHLMNVYIKLYTGRLSATCGCGVSAATSACAAMVMLMGGTLEQIEKAIVNMGADLTGMICDGGKIGCALKLASASNAAVMCAFLAMEDVSVPSDNGICGRSAEETIVNMGRISGDGMKRTDQTILKIMLDKEA